MTRVMCSHSIEAPIPSRVKSRPPHIEHESEAAETPERVLTRNTNRSEALPEIHRDLLALREIENNVVCAGWQGDRFCSMVSIAHTAITGTQARGMISREELVGTAVLVVIGVT